MKWIFYSSSNSIIGSNLYLSKSHNTIVLNCFLYKNKLNQINWNKKGLVIWSNYIIKDFPPSLYISTLLNSTQSSMQIVSFHFFCLNSLRSEKNTKSNFFLWLNG